MQFYIQRGNKTQGPFSQQQLIEFVRAKKVVGTDLISNSAEGPFQELKTVWDSIKNLPQVDQQPTPQQPASQQQTPPIPSATAGQATATEQSPNQPPPTPEVPATTGGPNWILIGGISGGVLLILIVIIIVMNSGQGQSGDNLASDDNSSNSADNNGSENQNANSSDLTTAEEFVVAVLETLKKNDFDRYMAIISLTWEDLQHADHSYTKESYEKISITNHTAVHQKNFSDVRFMAKDLGIDWDSARWVRFYTRDAKGSDGAKTHDLCFTVLSKNQTFEFNIKNIIKLNNDVFRSKQNTNKSLGIRRLGYIVPDKIEKLPPKYKGRELYDYLTEIKKLEPGVKGQFEKTEDYQRRIKETWNNATLFGQPLNSRWIYVIESKPSYDADKEEIRMGLDAIPRKLVSPSTKTKYIALFLRLANLNIKSKSISLNLPPKEAQQVMSQLRVAYVFRLGPHSGAGQSPAKLTDQTRSSTDSYIRDVRIPKGTVISMSYEIWVKELCEVIVYREDTGEVVHRLEMEPKPAQKDSNENKKNPPKEKDAPEADKKTPKTDVPDPSKKDANKDKKGTGKMDDSDTAVPAKSPFARLGNKFAVEQKDDSYEVVEVEMVDSKDPGSSIPKRLKKIGVFAGEKERKVVLVDAPTLSPGENFAVGLYGPIPKDNDKKRLVRYVDIMSTKTGKIVTSIESGFYIAKSDRKLKFSPKEGFVYCRMLSDRKIIDLSTGADLIADNKVKYHMAKVNSFVLNKFGIAEGYTREDLINGFSSDDRILVFTDGSYITLKDRTVFETGRKVKPFPNFPNRQELQFEFVGDKIEFESRGRPKNDGKSGGLPGFGDSTGGLDDIDGLTSSSSSQFRSRLLTNDEKYIVIESYNSKKQAITTAVDTLTGKRIASVPNGFKNLYNTYQAAKEKHGFSFDEDEFQKWILSKGFRGITFNDAGSRYSIFTVLKDKIRISVFDAKTKKELAKSDLTEIYGDIYRFDFGGTDVNFRFVDEETIFATFPYALEPDNR